MKDALLPNYAMAIEGEGKVVNAGPVSVTSVSCAEVIGAPLNVSTQQSGN